MKLSEARANGIKGPFKALSDGIDPEVEPAGPTPDETPPEPTVGTQESGIPLKPSGKVDLSAHRMHGTVPEFWQGAVRGVAETPGVVGDTIGSLIEAAGQNPEYQMNAVSPEASQKAGEAVSESIGTPALSKFYDTLGFLPTPSDPELASNFQAGKPVGAAFSQFVNPFGALKFAANPIGAVRSGAQKFLGVYDKATAAIANSIAKQGYNVGIGSYAESAPILQRNIELSRVYGYDPIKKGAQALAFNRSVKILTDTGMPLDRAEKQVKQMSLAAAVDAERAGKMVKIAALKDAKLAQKTFDAKIEALQQHYANIGMNDAEIHRNIISGLESDMKVLDKLMDERLGRLQEDLNNIASLSDPSDVGSVVASRLKEGKQLFYDQARRRYQVAELALGKFDVSVEGLAEDARGFLQSMPGDMKTNSPQLVQAIAKLAQETEEGGTATHASLAELHFLRNELRAVANNMADKLAGDFKNRAFPFFSGKVDDLIQGALENPASRPAVTELNKIDDWFAENVKWTKDAELNMLVAQMKSGHPPDPHAIAQQIFNMTQNNKARLGTLIDKLGPEAVDKVRAADWDLIQKLAHDPKSETLDPAILLEELSKRQRYGVLEKIWGKQGADQAIRLAKEYAVKVGTAKLPIVKDSEFLQLMQNRIAAADRLNEIMKANPNGATEIFERAIKEGEAEVAQAGKEFKEAQSANPLNVLADKSLAAGVAIKKLMNPDNVELLRAAIKRWTLPDGTTMKPLDLLRQYAVNSVIAPISRTAQAVESVEFFKNLTTAQQKMLFPGAQLDDIRDLLKELQFIYGRKQGSASSLAAGSMLSERGGVTAIFQRYVGRHIQNLTTRLITDPRTVLFLTTMVKSKDALAQKAGREELLKLLRQVIAADQTATQAATPARQGETPSEIPTAPEPFVPWRERFFGKAPQ